MFGRRAQGSIQSCRWDDEIPAGSAPLVVLVPGHAAPVYSVELPKGLGGSARTKVARQSLADKLGLPATTLDIVPVCKAGTKARDWNRAICLAAEDRRHWCQTALARDPRVRAVLPDYFILPGATGTVTLCAETGQVRARLGPDDGFTAPAPLAAILLRKALEQGDWSRALLLSDLPPVVSDVVAAAGLETERADARSLRINVQPDLACDLRHAETSQAEVDAGTLRVISAAMAIAIFAFAIWAASMLLDIRTITRDTTEVRRATTEVLRRGLLPDGPILDIRQQVAQRLETRAGAEQTAGSWPLDRLSRISVVLFGKGARVETLIFEPTRGHTALVLARDFESAEALIDALRDDSLAPVDVSVRAGARGDVELRFRVPAPASEARQ